MRFLIIGDLHGKLPKFYFKSFDAIIVPGDICSDEGMRDGYTEFYKHKIENPHSKKQWFDFVGIKKAKKIAKASITKGEKILKLLDKQNVPVYFIPGNWDWPKNRSDVKGLKLGDPINQLIKKSKNIINVHDKRRKITKELDIIGYGYCNGPELLKHRAYNNLSKDDYAKNLKKYKKLKKRYQSLFKRKTKPILFLSHNIPFETKLDKITDKKSIMFGKHFGSNLARDMIDKFQPLICIGGHMHEHFGKTKIKKTIIVNAGFGPKVNTILDINQGKISKLQFYPKPYGKGRA